MDEEKSFVQSLIDCKTEIEVRRGADPKDNVTLCVVDGYAAGGTWIKAVLADSREIWFGEGDYDDNGTQTWVYAAQVECESECAFNSDIDIDTDFRNYTAMGGGIIPELNGLTLRLPNEMQKYWGATTVAALQAAIESGTTKRLVIHE